MGRTWLTIRDKEPTKKRTEKNDCEDENATKLAESQWL